MKLIKISFYLVLSLFLFAYTIQAEGVEKGRGKVYKTTGSPAATKFNINNISTFFYNNGDSDISNLGSSGFEFPFGSGKTIFYESGFLYGGYVKGEWRVGGSTYAPSAMLPGGIISPTQQEDPKADHVRIYRVRRDYKDPNADYSHEITDEGLSKDAIYAQYDKDWNQWPAQYGAPYEDKNGNGKYDPTVDIPGFPGADQTIWYVMNDQDPVQAQKMYGSVGLGVEIQVTVWGYNQSGALGDALFRKYKVINKGGNDVDSCYVCMWADPDLGGDAGDDFAGCDTLLSLGFIYNGDDSDPSYGRYIPAAGFDFLQGPLLPGLPTDKAIFDNKIKNGYTNMPMTAFFMFTQSIANWTDPTIGSYTNGALRVRNLFQGKIGSLGTPFTDPLTGKTTKFCVPGDPVTGKGWVDGILFPKQDRRLGTVSGPFFLAAGDTQEVVVGQLAAGGVAPVTHIGAVALLKFQDKQVQNAYDNFFKVPPSPQAPAVPLNPITKIGTASEFDKKIIITWGEDAAIVNKTETYDTQGYKFEGYVVYQLPSLNAQISEGKIVATFDLKTDPSVVISATFDPNTNQETRTVSKYGENSGIQRTITINKDLIRGGIPLANGTEYYFVVSSYVVHSDPDVVPNVLESFSARILAVPHQPDPGTKYTVEAGSSISYTHPQGGSDGKVIAKVVDPSKVNGNSYEITFQGAIGNTTWTLVNKTTGKTLFTGLKEAQGVSSPLADGLQVDMTGAPNEFTNFQVTANANGPLNPPVSCTVNWTESLGGKWPNAGTGQQKSGAVWVLSHNGATGYAYADFVKMSTQYSGGYGEPNMGIGALIPDDFEFRFTAKGSEGFFHWTGGKVLPIPFEIWCSNGTADPKDDFQCLVYVNDLNKNDKFDLNPIDNTISGGTNDPQTDVFYFVIPFDRTPGSKGYTDLLNLIKADPAQAVDYVLWAYYDTDYKCYPGMIRLVFVGFNLIEAANIADLPAEKRLPETGTIFKISTSKPNVPTSGTSGDIFRFTAPTVVKNDMDLAKEAVEDINVFPNPYYGVNPREINKYQRFVTFSHLPAKATLRIFNLAGQLVRTIEKNSPSQFTTWDLVNEDSFPVASGLYLVHVDMPDLGKTKILKLAIIQEQQILDHY